MGDDNTRDDAGNSAGNSAKRVIGKPFQPGQSGNPNGRPRIPDEVRAIFDDASPTAARKIVEMAATDGHPDQYRACVHILDRKLGKVRELLEVTDNRTETVTVATVREAVLEMAKDPEQRAVLRALARGPN